MLDVSNLLIFAATTDWTAIVLPPVMLALGIAIGSAILTLKHRAAMTDAEGVSRQAKAEADQILKDAKIAAKEEIIKARDDFENSTKSRRKELQKLEDRVSEKEANIERKADVLDKRIADLEKREDRARTESQRNAEEQGRLRQLLDKHEAELERVAGLSREEAKAQLLDQLEEQLETEQAALIRRAQEEGTQRLEEQATEVMVTAMQRYAGECTYERTTSTIPLPNDEMKGRIIGREGRNIRAIEAATGASVLIDDTPEAVVISCFDPVRKEVARQAMLRLVSDGRIHPSRIEEMVGKVRKEVEAEVMKAGQEVVEQINAGRVNKNLVRLLGTLKFRFSYSQNVLKHSVEVASMMGMIAAQMGIDERKARRAGLLHDIGKAVDHEIEGSHAVIGADILKREGEDADVVNAVAAHHEDVEKTSPLAVLVECCDTLSAGRPGARSETTELYLKRIEQLENIGNDFPGVESCFAIQAGRELRVIVNPENIDEDKALVLAREMAERIEKEMRYPGQIKVAIIRETRAVEYAK